MDVGGSTLVFVHILLVRISGVPALEAGADRKWGRDVDYQNHRARTPVLWLRSPGKS